jgi:hypothetical protein
MRLYYGGYGHNPSGKQYAYWGSDNYRTGQNVVAPVTNKRTGNTYNTMFTIMRTSGETSQMAQAEAQRLEGMGIDLKTIGSRDVLSLPSGSQYTSKSQWATESRERFLNEARTRLSARAVPTDTTQASQRLLSRGI